MLVYVCSHINLSLLIPLIQFIGLWIFIIFLFNLICDLNIFEIWSFFVEVNSNKPETFDVTYFLRAGSKFWSSRPNPKFAYLYPKSS